MKRLLLYVYLYMLVMFLAVNFVIVPVHSRAVEDYLQPHINPYWRDMVRGPYHVIESKLKDLPLEQWGRAVETLQRHFAYPIEIKPMDAKQLPEAEALALRRGEIVVQGFGESFEHQIGTSGLVLRMGPMPEVGSSIPDIESKVRWCNIQLYLSIFVIFFGFALIWTLPFARNLKGLSKPNHLQRRRIGFKEKIKIRRTTKRCWRPLQRHWSVENQSSLKKRPDLTNKAAQL